MSSERRRTFFALWGLAMLGFLGAAGCGSATTGRPTETPSQPSRLDGLRAAAAQHPDDGALQLELGEAELLDADGDARRAPEPLARAARILPGDPRPPLLACFERQLHGHPDEAVVAALDALERARASDRPDAALLAEIAATELSGLDGATAGYEALVRPRVEAMLAAPGGLGPMAMHELTLLAMDLAYRDGDMDRVRALREARGCVVEWRIAGPFGPRALLDVDREDPAGAVGEMAERYDLGPRRGVRATRRIEARGCSIHLGGDPISGPGSTYVEAFVEVAAQGRYVLRVDSPNHFEVRIDGHEVARRDGIREASASVIAVPVDLAPGRHEIGVKVTTRHPNPVLAVALMRPDGRGAFGTSAEGGAPAAAPVLDPPRGDATVFGRFVAAEIAAIRGDVVRARTLLHGLSPDLAGGILVLSLRAGIALRDPLRPSDMRRDEARRVLRAMKDRDPDTWYPALQLPRLEAAEGRDLEAITALTTAADRWPKQIELPLELVNRLLDRGWDSEVDRWIRKIRETQPDACGPISLELQVARRRDRTADIDRHVEALVACDTRSQARLTRLLERRSWDAAVAELDRLVALEPRQNAVDFDGTRLDIAEARGDARAAARLVDSMRERLPLSDAPVLRQADRAFARGQRAEAIRILDTAMEVDAGAMAGLRRVRSTIATDDVLGPYRVDGAEVLRAYEASGRQYDQPQVMVLDYMVERVFPDGSALRLVHNIFKLQSEEAVDDKGEFAPPDGALLLTLRTIKADGTRLEPDLLPGKDTISLPNLEVGDYVEWEYVDFVDPSGGFPTGFIGVRFFFQRFEIPFDRSELVLVAPESLDFALDPRGPAPETQRATAPGGLVVRRWRVNESRPLIPEPLSVSPEEYLPSVRYGYGVAWRDLVESILDALADRDVLDPEAVHLAERVVRGATTEREKAQKIYYWLLDNVENSDEVFGLAPAMLADRTGNRSRLLRYLLGLVGVRSDLLLVRNFEQDQTRSEMPDADTYSNVVVRAYLDGTPVDLAPNARGTPFGYLTRTFRGQDALVLTRDGGRVEIPEGPPEQDLRSVAVDLTLAPDGGARVQVRETFHGGGAINWRGALEEIPAATLFERFEEQYVAQLFPGASLVSLDVAGREDPEAPIVFTYAMDVPALARRQGGRLLLAALFRSGLARGLAPLPSRTTPEGVPDGAAVDVVVRVQTSGGLGAAEALRDVELRGPGGSTFRMRSRREGEVLVVDRRVRVPQIRVAAADYPALARFARSAEEAEAREIRIPVR